MAFQFFCKFYNSSTAQKYEVNSLEHSLQKAFSTADSNSNDIHGNRRVVRPFHFHFQISYQSSWIIQTHTHLLYLKFFLATIPRNITNYARSFKNKSLYFISNIFNLEICRKNHFPQIDFQVSLFHAHQHLLHSQLVNINLLLL